jgi:LAS seventeen-binding protein 5
LFYSALPPPIRPRNTDGDAYGQGSLSDYSDYSSSEDERDRYGSPSTAATSTASGSRAYRSMVDDDDDDIMGHGDAGKGLLAKDDDPFADPFADNEAVSDVGTPGIEKKRLEW